jgi:hypothetical protein
MRYSGEQSYLLEENSRLIFTTNAVRKGDSLAFEGRLVEAAGFRDRVSGVLVDEIAGHVAFAVLGAGPALVARRSATFPLKRRSQLNEELTRANDK